MRLLIARLTCLVAGGMSLAIADQPPPAAAPPSATAAPAAEATPATAAPAAAAATPAKPAAPSADELDKKLKSEGYHVVERNGNKLYCRPDTVMGSRFPAQVCGTADQIAQTTQNARDNTEKGQRQQYNPTGH